MTREDREFAKSRIEYLLKADNCLDKHDREALEIAIQSLSQEPCDDAISRKKVEEMIKAEMPERGAWEIGGNKGDVEKQTVCEVCVDLLQSLNELPPVTQKSGTWIDRQFQSKIDGEIRNGWECSECGDRFFRYDLVNTDEFTPKFCPNCGAKMESEE